MSDPLRRAFTSATARGSSGSIGSATPRAVRIQAIPSGSLANYLYDHDSIEDNHEAFVRDRTIVRSPDVDALLETSLCRALAPDDRRRTRHDIEISGPRRSPAQAMTPDNPCHP